MPDGRLVVVMVMLVVGVGVVGAGAGAVSLTIRVNSFVAGAPEAGLALTVKVYVPAVTGVPDKVPVDLSSTRPSGRDVPLASAHTIS